MEEYMRRTRMRRRITRRRMRTRDEDKDEDEDDNDAFRAWFRFGVEMFLDTFASSSPMR